MENQSFFKTKAGGLTLVFLIMMMAFGIIMAGLGLSNDVLCTVGFLMVIAAMLYSPIRVFIIERKK